MLVESEDEYHARSKCGEVMSSHMLHLFLQSPRKWRMLTSGEVKPKDSDSLSFGRAAHKMILEGIDEFSKCYTVDDGPINPKTGMPYGKTTAIYHGWLAGIEGDVISTADYNTIFQMRENIYFNGCCNELLEPGIHAEGVFRAVIEGVPCQIRVDALNENGIIDLKTCRDIEYFEKDCRDFGYPYQMAFYRMVLEEATGVHAPCHLIATDKTDYHLSGRWDMVPVELDKCEQVLRAGLRKFAKCMNEETFPTGYEDARTTQFY